MTPMQRGNIVTKLNHFRRFNISWSTGWFHRWFCCWFRRWTPRWISSWFLCWLSRCWSTRWRCHCWSVGRICTGIWCRIHRWKCTRTHRWISRWTGCWVRAGIVCWMESWDNRRECTRTCRWISSWCLSGRSRRIDCRIGCAKVVNQPLSAIISVENINDIINDESGCLTDTIRQRILELVHYTGILRIKCCECFGNSTGSQQGRYRINGVHVIREGLVILSSNDINDTTPLHESYVCPQGTVR